MAFDGVTYGPVSLGRILEAHPWAPMPFTAGYGSMKRAYYASRYNCQTLHWQTWAVNRYNPGLYASVSVETQQLTSATDYYLFYGRGYVRAEATHMRVLQAFTALTTDNAEVEHQIEVFDGTTKTVGSSFGIGVLPESSPSPSVQTPGLADQRGGIYIAEAVVSLSALTLDQVIRFDVFTSTDETAPTVVNYRPVLAVVQWAILET